MHSVEEIALMHRIPSWRVRRLFEAGDLPEPRRFAGARVLTDGDLPIIEAALMKRGWLPTKVAA